MDLLLAKGEIAELRKEALDKINTYKRRYDSLGLMCRRLGQVYACGGSTMCGVLSAVV